MPAKFNYETVVNTSSAGIVTIPSDALLSPVVPVILGTYFDGDGYGVTGKPKAGTYPNTSVVLFNPCGVAASTAALPSVTAGAFNPSGEFYSPVPSSPKSRYFAGGIYKEDDLVYYSSGPAVPFKAYKCLGDNVVPIPPPAGDVASSYWSEPIVGAVSPWLCTAAYNTSLVGYVSYFGKLYYPKETIAARPVGNPTPDSDTANWELITSGFRLELASGVTATTLCYSYQILNCPSLICGPTPKLLL